MAGHGTYQLYTPFKYNAPQPPCNPLHTTYHRRNILYQVVAVAVVVVVAVVVLTCASPITQQKKGIRHYFELKPLSLLLADGGGGRGEGGGGIAATKIRSFPDPSDHTFEFKSFFLFLPGGVGGDWGGGGTHLLLYSFDH